MLFVPRGPSDPQSHFDRILGHGSCGQGTYSIPSIVTVTNTGNANFQLMTPARSTRPASGRGTRRLGVTAPASILLQIRGRRITAGTHAISLKLSRAAFRRLLSGRGPARVTIRVTVIDGYGSAITRSLTVTLRP